MAKLLLIVLTLTALAWSKDLVQVQVVATHAVTHEARDVRAMMEKGLSGAHGPTRQIESFNLDTIINGEHVLLACTDTKGCEAPAVGTYDGELVRGGKWVKVTFMLPLREKRVTRWYRIAGSWQ